MRKPKSETVAEYRDEFLAGKSEDYKNRFNEKTLHQQYIAISNWKRNAMKLANSTKDLAKVTANTVVSYLKEAHKKLQKLETLSPKEAQKIQSVLDNVKGAVDNFDKMKKQQYLAYLEAEKDKLAKQGDALSRQIEELRSQLG